MEKRRYNKGFHIGFTKRKVSKKVEKDEATLVPNSNKLRKESNVIPESSENASVIQSNDLSSQVELESADLAADVDSAIEGVTHTKKGSESVKSTDNHSGTSLSKEVNRELSTKSSSDPWIPSGLLYFSIFALIPLMMLSKRSSYRIGNWAAENASKARLAIVGLYGVGFSASFLLGNMWQPEIEQWMGLIPTSIAGAAALIHLKSKGGLKKKTMSFATINASSFFGSFALGSMAKANLLLELNPEPNTGFDSGIAALVTILLVLAMMAALSGIAILSCQLACSGYGIWALLVFAGGSFIILFLGTWGIMGAIHGRARNGQNLKVALITALIPTLITLLIALISSVS